MHHALFISEISRKVCTTLDRSSLLAVACTSRALHDPALDELWRDLYSIYPFVHLLTQATPEESQRTCVQRLTSQQWTTLRRYSARTRSLYMCMIDDSPYFDRFPCLSNPPDPHAFFSNLQTIAWYPDNHLAMLPFLRLLCGPALTSLSAEFATDSVSLATVAALGTLCPNITNISISASTDSLSDDLANALSTSVCQWKHLKQVSCDDLTPSAIQHLSRAKNLTCLTACASGRLSSFSRPLDEPSFPHLRHLHLYTGLLSTATACLNGFRLALEEFRLDLFDADESSSLRTLFTTLSQSSSHPHLANLYLSIVHPRFPSLRSTATIHDLGPLFAFVHLRVVSLEGISFSLDDEDIATLSRTWPNVQELALSTYVDHSVASIPTLNSLLRLVHTCPKLRALSIVVDATKFSTASVWMVGLDEEDGGTSSSRSNVLEDLCLGNSPISSPVIVARILHHLYPSLKQVDLSVWNKEPLNWLPRRDRYEVYWGTVNIELQNWRAR